MNRPLLQQRTSQNTTLTPRLQQSVHLLQLSSADFAQELDEAVASNPFLEVGGETDRTADGSTDTGDADVSRSTDASHDATHDAAGDRHDEAHDGPYDNARTAPSDDGRDTIQSRHDGPRHRDVDDDGDGDASAWQAVDVDLKAHLTQALASYRLGARDHAIASFVIEALDDDGYLRQDLAQLVAGEGEESPIEASELSTALHWVQQLGPAGIAARDASECLALQLVARLADASAPDDPAVVAVALEIVRHHLARLARRDWVALTRLLGERAGHLQAAVAMIRSLNPRPGLAFGGSTAHAIVPDVVVRRGRTGWTCETNPNVMPRTQLNARYAELFHRARLDDRQPLAQQLQEARWLLRNVAQRFVTIQRVATAIVAEQHAFFDHGDIAIKPLALRQVADRLELHESTISRATQGKYMATPRGVFEFKHFFSRHLATQTGGSASTTSIRAAIRELIDQEAAGQPLSDVELAQRLTLQGLCVARRTVSKYRALMRIPAAELRRA